MSNIRDLANLKITCWKLTPVVSLSLTFLAAIALYTGLIHPIVFFITIAILCIVQIVKFFKGLYDITFNEGEFNRHLALTVTAIAFPVLLVFNLRAFDYVGTYLVVRVMEPYLLDKGETSAVKHSAPNSSFKYFRLRFGQIGKNRRWLVYDESQQVSQDYMTRNKDWWQVSKEASEVEGCASNGVRLNSNFFVQYYGRDCY